MPTECVAVLFKIFDPKLQHKMPLHQTRNLCDVGASLYCKVNVYCFSLIICVLNYKPCVVYYKRAHAYAWLKILYSVLRPFHYLSSYETGLSVRGTKNGKTLKKKKK